MKFRYARHTAKLEPIIAFYTQVIGLQKLAEFQSHINYNGVFLGFPELDWHLEFTESGEEPDHQPDPDDLLVFYTRSEQEFNSIEARIKEMQIPIETSKNPYWTKKGIEVHDPDGFGLIIVRPN